MARIYANLLEQKKELAAVSLFWDTNMAAVTSCENTLLPAEQESWVLSELDKKKGELTCAISTRGRMFWHVHRVSRALISLCPLPFETPSKQTIWEQDKFYRTIIICEFIYLLRNYIVFYLCRRSYLI